MTTTTTTSTSMQTWMRHQQESSDVPKNVGNSICKVQEITNAMWQAKHRSAKKDIVKGHWNQFIRHVGGLHCSEVRKCDDCMGFVQCTHSTPPEEVVLRPRYAELPAGSSQRRGRPKKGEVRDFDLQAWLQKERPGQYHLYHKDVVVSSRKKNTKTTAEKAAHVRCLLCHGEFRVQRNNLVALNLHEASKMHTKALGVSEAEALVPQVPDLAECTGLDFSDQKLVPDASPCGSMRAGFMQWAALGCPDVLSSRDSWIATVTEDKKLILRNPACKKLGDLCDYKQACCQRCGRLPYMMSVVQAVSKMLYRIHLVDLMTLAMQNQAEEMMSFWEAARQAPWARHVPYDLSPGLAQCSFPQLFRRCQQVIGGVDPSLRNAAFQTWVVARMGWVTPGAIPEPTKASQVQECAVAMLDPQRGTQNGKLARLIESGVLEADSTARVLVAALVQKADRMSRGLKRVGKSSVDGVEEHMLHQVMFKLLSGMSRTECLKTFGISKGVSSAKELLGLEFLPKFFCPSLEQLEANARLALGHMGISSTREYMVLWDDTVYTQGYSLIYGLREGPVIIGGAHPHSSVIVPESGMGELEKSKLAQVTMSFLIKRLDRRSGTWDIRMGPRRLTQVTADAQLRLCGETVWAATIANDNKPPLILAYDNHASHQKINAILMGIAAPPDDIPFFQNGRPGRALPVPLFPFRPFLFEQQVVFGANDAAHVLKAVAGNLRRACRVVHFCSNVLWCDMTGLRCQGLSSASFLGRDVQSDRQAAELLTPRGKCQWDRPSSNS